MSPDASRMPAEVRRAVVIGTAVAVVLFGALLSGGSPGGFVERGPFTSDFFDEQAESLLDGRLAVDPAVAALEGFRVGDETHLYFGLVPSLLRVPVVALVGDDADGRLTQLSMLIALVVALAAASSLLWRARIAWVGDEPLPPRTPLLMGAATAALGLSTPLLFLASRPVVYHEVELWGVATTLVSAGATLRWWDRRRTVDLVLASAAVVIAMNTRASVGGGAVASLALVGARGLWQRRWPWRTAGAIALALLIPVGTYAAVNQARFGSWFDVPFEDQVLSAYDASRQAALEATDGAFFSPGYAPSALATYLRPDGVSLQALFPWVTFREEPTLIGDPTFDTIDRSGSLPATSPALFALALVGLGALLGRDRRGPWLPLAGGLVLGLVPTVTIAFIAHRYLADFVPLLVLLAVHGVWAVRMWARRRRAPVVAAVGALAVIGLLVTSALAVQTQRLLLLPSDADRVGFVELQYDLDRTLRDRPAPNVTQADEVGPPGPRGAVAILGDCDALYWSDGLEWRLLEVGPRYGWALHRAVPSSGTTLLEADGWALRAERPDVDHVRLVYEGATRKEGRAFSAAVDDVVDLAVALDPVNGRLRVESGDDPVLDARRIDVGGDPAPPEPADPTPADPRLCEELSETLEA